MSDFISLFSKFDRDSSKRIKEDELQWLDKQALAEMFAYACSDPKIKPLVERSFQLSSRTDASKESLRLFNQIGYDNAPGLLYSWIAEAYDKDGDGLSYDEAVKTRVFNRFSLDNITVKPFTRVEYFGSPMNDEVAGAYLVPTDEPQSNFDNSNPRKIRLVNEMMIDLVKSSLENYKSWIEKVLKDADRADGRNGLISLSKGLPVVLDAYRERFGCEAGTLNKEAREALSSETGISFPNHPDETIDFKASKKIRFGKLLNGPIKASGLFPA